MCTSSWPALTVLCAVYLVQTVVMSEAKQALLQSLLKEGFAASSGAQNPEGSGSSARRAAPLDPVLLAEVESQLLPMGFSQQQVQQATAAVAGHRKLATTSAADLALDWLFIHLSRDQLPAHFTRGTCCNGGGMEFRPATTG